MVGCKQVELTVVNRMQATESSDRAPYSHVYRTREALKFELNCV